MGARTNRMAMLAQARAVLWYETDALFAWNPQSSDGASITPILGGVLSKTSAAQAVGYDSGTKLFDMTNGVYAGNTGMTATLDTTKPFLIAIAIDKNAGATAAFQFCFEIGASSNIIFESATSGTQPTFKLQLNTGAFSQTQACIATMPAGGTTAIYWCYGNPGTAGTASGQIITGNNQNAYVTSAATLTYPTSGFPTANTTVGAGYSSTTNVSKYKHGATQVVGNRSGASALTYAQALAIVQKMQNLYGI